MLKMIVADDGSLVREGICNILDWSIYGIEIVGEAANGEEALKLSREMHADILFTDVKMPVMDGLEAAQIIKEEQLDMKVIIFSGIQEFEYAKKAIKVNAEGYILKPLEKKELIQAVKEVTRQIEIEKNRKEMMSKLKEQIKENRIAAEEKFLRNLLLEPLEEERKVVDKLAYFNFPFPLDSKFLVGILAIDAEHLKRVYDILVCESGAEILFHSFLCSVETDENGSVSEIIVSNKSGLTAYKGKVFIDCTGDGDLAAWAGAEFMLGDEESKELQPASLCFVLTNVDDYAYQYGPRLHNSNLQSPIFEMMKSGEFPRIVDSHCCNQMVGPGAVCFNAGHLWKVDNTEPGSISQSLIEGRKIAKEFQEALAKYQPKAFGNSFLAATGSLMGIRETRRIVGEYVLTEEDYLQRKGFYDEIGRNSYYIDIHHSEHESSLETIKDFDWEKHRARYGAGESYGIPFRCLVPKGLKNVLIAGRSVSCDRAVQGSIRVMPACLVMGEGAGAAASLMVKEEMVNTDLCGPKIKKLQKLLLGHGAYFRSSETL